MQRLKKMREKHDLESQHEAFIKNDFLMKITEEFLEKAEIIASENKRINSESLKVLEIGGAGGGTKALRPEWIVTDIRDCKGVDLIASAYSLPFKNESFDLIVGIDVLHHLSDRSTFYHEMHRVLSSQGAIVFREPYWGLLAQFIWRLLHPEDFSLKRLRQVSSFNNPMEGNQATAWGILKKNIDDSTLHGLFEVKTIGIQSASAFVLSGGATFSTKVPKQLLIKLHSFESKFRWWMKIFGVSIVFVMIKN